MRKVIYLHLLLVVLVGFATSSSFAMTAPTQRVFQASGTISYSVPPSLNLGVIPDDWDVYDSHPNSWTAIVHLDYSVTHNGNVSIRIDPHTSADTDFTRECDGRWYNIKPGDHLVVRIWIKTSASSTSDTDPQHGGRIGWDYYAHTSAGYHIVDARPNQVDYDSGIYTQHVVPWNMDWTYKEIDITVPTGFYSQFWDGSIGGWHSFSPSVQIDSFVCWLDVRPIADMGVAWFADATVYINPVG